MSLLRRAGPVCVAFLAFWLLLAIGGRTKLLRDPGTFWHTSVGEKILHDGFFRTDPYSFTRAGARWIPHQWLGEVSMALLYRIGGFDAQLVAAAAILAALFAWLTVRMLRTGIHPILAAMVPLIALAAGSLQFHVRPLLMTMVFLAATSAVLSAYDAGRIPRAKLLWLLPLFIVWTNIHGGVLAGIVTLFLIWLGWTVARLLGWPSPLRNPADSGFVLGLAILCGFSVLLNPYGLDIPRAWMEIMRGNKLPDLIEEHKRLDPADLSSWPLFAFAALYFVMLAGLRERPRLAWLIPCLWIAPALLRVRHGPLFAIVAAVAIAEIWPKTRWAAILASRRPDLYQPDPARGNTPAWAWIFPAGFVAAVLVIQSLGIIAPLVGRGWAAFDREKCPLELTPALRHHEPPAGEPNTLFNSCNLGGFAIFTVPGYKVFIDDRVELYGEDFFEEFVRGQAPGHAANALARWQREYGPFDFALVSPESDYATVFRQDADHWETVDASPAAVFFRRKK